MNVIQESRRITEIFRFSVAVIEAGKDTQNLEVTLESHPFDVFPEHAEVCRDRDAYFAGFIPIANGPIQNLSFAPGDKGVSAQAGNVIADRTVYLSLIHISEPTRRS